MNRFGGSVWIELAREAVAGLRAQGRRSVLALLGVMIGSASVVALMSFSHIAKTEVMARFQQVGVDTVQIAADLTSERGIDPLRLDAVLQNGSAVVAAANMAVGRSYVSLGRDSVSAGIAAVSPEALEMLRLHAGHGRNLTLLDGCNGAVVLGAGLAKETGAKAGDTAYIDSYGFQVVGVLPPTDKQALNPVNPDETAFIGLPCSRRVVTKPGITHALVRVNAARDPSEWAEAARLDLVKGPQTALHTAELAYEGQLDRIEGQVREAVADVQSRWRQLEAANRAKALALRSVEIQQERLRAGRASNFEVLSLQTSLRSADSQALSARIAYLNALTSLDQQLGRTLETWQISLEP